MVVIPKNLVKSISIQIVEYDGKWQQRKEVNKCIKHIEKI